MRSIEWIHLGMIIAIALGLSLCDIGCAPIDLEAGLTSGLDEEIDPSDPILGCELPPDPVWNRCASGAHPWASRPMLWYTSDGSEAWRPAIRRATEWWSRQLDVEWIELHEGTGIEIGWHEERIPGAYAHAHGIADQQSCELTGEGWVRIDFGTTATGDVSLIAHELGHVLGYAHDDREGSIMQRYYESIKRDCGEVGR